MKPATEHTIFNSIDSSALNPKATKPLPFPLENFDQEIGIAYAQTDRIYKKLQAAEHNPVNNTPAKKRRLASLKYKTETCLNLLKNISDSTAELFF